MKELPKELYYNIIDYCDINVLFRFYKIYIYDKRLIKYIEQQIYLRFKRYFYINFYKINDIEISFKTKIDIPFKIPLQTLINNTEFVYKTYLITLHFRNV
jgi:hypothetical protein